MKKYQKSSKLLNFLQPPKTVGNVRKDSRRLGKSSEALKIMIFHDFHDF